MIDYEPNDASRLIRDKGFEASQGGTESMRRDRGVVRIEYDVIRVLKMGAI